MLHNHYRSKHTHDPRRRFRLLSLLLAALVLFIGLPVCDLGAKAATTPTSLGLAMQGITAHREGWLYVAGGKGQKVNGVRATDCAGLLYSYYSDCGVSGCAGGATSQVRLNTIFSGAVSQGLPRIHGLALTNSEPGGYSHIGIYIGNNESCDNSMVGVNMRRASVQARHWDGWHLFDLGTLYPKNGWYEFDGRMVHYTNYEYDVSTTIGGYTIGSDGFAYLEDGRAAPVDRSILSGLWARASEVAAYLETQGWNGSDDPNAVPFDYNATVNGSDVNMRSGPNTYSSIVATLSRDTRLLASPAVSGQTIFANGRSYSMWYPVSTASGKKGYISEAYVALQIGTPSITCLGDSVTMTAGGSSGDIYYTTDGTDPASGSASTVPYVSPVYKVGCTYKAAVIKNGISGPVAAVTVTSSGAVFDDFNYNHWFASYVDRAVALGLFSGCGNKKFCPVANITRAQFVTVLAAMSGEDMSGYSLPEDIFTDVPANAYYTRQLAWAAENGIVARASRFNPNQAIPREQMCVMMDRFLSNVLGVTEVDTSMVEKFADDDSISDFAKESAYRMRALGLITGVGDNRLAPKGASQRCAGCVVAVQIHDKFMES